MLKKETEDRLLGLAGTLIASAILFVIGFGAGFVLTFRVLLISTFAESPVPLLIGGLIVGALAACIPFTINIPGAGTLNDIQKASRRQK